MPQRLVPEAVTRGLSNYVARLPDRYRDAVPWRRAEQHVNVIRHRIPLKQLDSLLTTQLPEYLPDLMTESSIHDFLADLRHNDHMVLTRPLCVGLVVPMFRDSSPVPFGGLPPGGLSYDKRKKRESLFNSHRQSGWIADLCLVEEFCKMEIRLIFFKEIVGVISLKKAHIPIRKALTFSGGKITKKIFPP